MFSPEVQRQIKRLIEHGLIHLGQHYKEYADAIKRYFANEGEKPSHRMNAPQYPLYNSSYLKEKYLKAAEYPPIFFRENSLCPIGKIAFMTEEDIAAKRYIVREFKLRDGELRYARRAGIKKKNWYDPNSPIIKSYGTLEEMTTDNWYADIGYVPAELNNVV